MATTKTTVLRTPATRRFLKGRRFNPDWSRMGVLIGGLVVCMSLASGLEAADKGAKDDAASAGVHKLLFLGNSITLHAPAPASGWMGNWGMAASAQEKDYVHLVTRALATPTKPAPEVMVKNIAAFERQYATYDMDSELKDAFGFGANLVVVAIGENVPRLKSDGAKRQFRSGVKKLLERLKANNQVTLVVRSSFWPNPVIDQILQETCHEAGGIFVDIGHLSKDEANYARSERSYKSKGVAAHPGDRGMQGIADAILQAINHEGKSGNDQ
jgi:hypothetical protein